MPVCISVRNRRLNTMVTVGLILSASVFTGPAAAEGITEIGQMDGRWIAEQDAVLTIQAKQNTLEIWGADAATSFQTHCVAEITDGKPTATCAGDGYNFITKRNFIYTSKLSVSDGKLIENWVAKFLDAAGDVELQFADEQSFEKLDPEAE